MIITLTGGNKFSLQAEQARLVAEFVAKQGDLSLERVDGEEVDYARILEALTSLPFLAARKLVVLRTPSKNKQFTERVEQILTDIPEATDVILMEPKLDKRLSYYKFLKSKTDYRDFPEQDEVTLIQWLIETVTDSSLKSAVLQRSDARYLVERVGTNQLLLSNELDKLLMYDPHVTRESIDLMTDATPQSTIFQLLEAAFAGQSRRTLDLYKEQRALKVEPPQIVAMLAWQLYVLAIVKTAEKRSVETIAKDAKLNPFVVRKSQVIARHISLTDLKKLVSDLLNIDTSSKRTNLNLDEALQDYLLKLGS